MNIIFKMASSLANLNFGTVTEINNQKVIDTEFLLTDGSYVPFQIRSDSGLFPLQYDKAAPGDDESTISCIRWYVSKLLKNFVKRELLDYGFWLTIHNLKAVDLKVNTINSFGDLQVQQLSYTVELQYKKGKKEFVEKFTFQGNKLKEATTISPELWKTLTGCFDNFIKLRSNVRMSTLSSEQTRWIENTYDVKDIKDNQKYTFIPLMVGRNIVDVLYLIDQPNLGIFELVESSNLF